MEVKIKIGEMSKLLKSENGKIMSEKKKQYMKKKQRKKMKKTSSNIPVKKKIVSNTI